MRMEHLNFIPLPNSSLIYGSACLKGERNRLLFATLEKQIFCVEYFDNQYFCNEINFAYLPHGSDIISIDAFERTNSCDVIVGITFKKSETDPVDFRKTSQSGRSNMNGRTGKNQYYYFNIYSSINSTNRFDLNQIAQDCQNSFELVDFVPTHLTHARLKLNGKMENFWLLSGSDCRVHIYQEDLKQQCFINIKIDIFPEFRALKHKPLFVTTMNISFYPCGDISRRITAIGHEDGLLKFSVIGHKENQKPEVLSTHEYQFDGPIFSTRFFTDSNAEKDFWFDNITFQQDRYFSIDNVHLFVGTSCETPVVFRDILQCGVSHKIPLIGALDKADIILSTLICDTTLDGFNNIIIGKYSKEMLVFQFNAQAEKYVIIERQSFSGPLHSIDVVDLIGDGVKELVVLTTKGISIRRHSRAKTADIFERKLKEAMKRIEYLLK